jgi:hypothetical protein
MTNTRLHAITLATLERLETYDSLKVGDLVRCCHNLRLSLKDKDPGVNRIGDLGIVVWISDFKADYNSDKNAFLQIHHQRRNTIVPAWSGNWELVR